MAGRWEGGPLRAEGVDGGSGCHLWGPNYSDKVVCLSVSGILRPCLRIAKRMSTSKYRKLNKIFCSAEKCLFLDFFPQFICNLVESLPVNQDLTILGFI